MVQHQRTDGPQPIVLTSNADGQRLVAKEHPCADGVWVMESWKCKITLFGSERARAISIGLSI